MNSSSIRVQDLMGVMRGARMVVDSMKATSQSMAAASAAARNTNVGSQSTDTSFDQSTEAASSTESENAESSFRRQSIPEFTSHYQEMRQPQPTTPLPTATAGPAPHFTQTHHVSVQTPLSFEPAHSAASHPSLKLAPDLASAQSNEAQTDEIPIIARATHHHQILRQDEHDMLHQQRIHDQQRQKILQEQQKKLQHEQQQQQIRKQNAEKMEELLRQQEALRQNAKERKVPTSRVSRLWHIGELAVGMGVGALGEITRRTLSGTSPNGQASTIAGSPLLNEANAQRITSTLCRMRGAALKLGQMLSIQDSEMVPPEFAQILEKVRHSADRMTTKQLEAMLVTELGKQWRSRLHEFDSVAIAAASIGQVHKARLLDGREVAMKIQYPGVAESIPSDIENLNRFLRLMGFIPQNMFRDLDNVVDVARTELMWEIDYRREANNQMRFKELLKDEPEYSVPGIIKELSTTRVLTAEFARGIPIEKIVDFDQETRNKVGERILRLCLKELFEYRFMQTDSNWSNFFYDPLEDKVTLLDFGACREFEKKFTDEYLRVIHAAANKDREGVLKASQEMGFLTGEENRIMNEAHVNAAMVVGEPFGTDKYDFGAQKVTHKVHELVPTMLKHRLAVPPTESYSLHRKLSGAFLLCTKLRAQIDCRSTFESVYGKYKFDS